jgi:hypothetical protein
VFLIVGSRVFQTILEVWRVKAPGAGHFCDFSLYRGEGPSYACTDGPKGRHFVNEICPSKGYLLGYVYQMSHSSLCPSTSSFKPKCSIIKSWTPLLAHLGVNLGRTQAPQEKFTYVIWLVICQLILPLESGHLFHHETPTLSFTSKVVYPQTQQESHQNHLRLSKNHIRITYSCGWPKKIWVTFFCEVHGSLLPPFHPLVTQCVPSNMWNMTQALC